MFSTIVAFVGELAWQDVVLTIGQIVFIFALLPMLFSSQKPPLVTCLMHGLILSSFAVAFASLALWFSAVSVFVVSLLWFYIAWQQYRRR